jgi:hypothetical protein
MIRYIPIVIAALALSACVSMGRYTGDEYYFTKDSQRYSCREPQPYPGGNCKLESQWATKGLN